MVYLSPELELESQEQVNFTVAHEFAHVVLKHSSLCWNPEQGKRDEQTADDLAKEWGFERPEQPYKINKEMFTVYRNYLASRAEGALSPVSRSLYLLRLFEPQLDASNLCIAAILVLGSLFPPQVMMPRRKH